MQNPESIAYMQKKEPDIYRNMIFSLLTFIVLQNFGLVNRKV